ncbi:unnamed protein product [Heligmosomoides polygyrus]|uniref:Energy-coupling factor transporter transmembrane protein EcfT n=1 Tax=Heligmosomoides polygyrus TaxID=6339 RepID=A0A183GH92_HELPZ|nr:unnamed protein product [Heligmosomoides polygyrus]
MPTEVDDLKSTAPPTANAKSGIVARIFSEARDNGNLKLFVMVALVILMHVWAVMAAKHDSAKAQPFLAFLGMSWLVATARLLSNRGEKLIEREPLFSIRLLFNRIKDCSWTPRLVCFRLFLG